MRTTYCLLMFIVQCFIVHTNMTTPPSRKYLHQVRSVAVDDGTEGEAIGEAG